MTTKTKPYKIYTREFKLEALRLQQTSGRAASDIARELGIRRKHRLKEEVAILKKAAAYFARELP